MKKLNFIACAICCATLAVAAENQSQPTGSSDSVDFSKIATAFGKLGLSYAQKSLKYGYDNLKPVGLKDGLIKALIVNNIAWVTPQFVAGLKSSTKSISQIVSLPLSVLGSYYAAKKWADFIGKDMDKNNKNNLYVQAFGLSVPVLQYGISSTLSKIVDALPGNRVAKKWEQLTENEQLEEAQHELTKATEIKGPKVGDVNKALEKIKQQCEQEAGIKKFADKLKVFDPANTDKSRTPTLFLYGPTSTGKTEKLKMLAKFANKLGYSTHFIFQSSMMQKQTYVGIASKLLNSYADELIKKHNDGEKVMVLLDEAFSASNELASKEGKTGNNNDDFTTFIDKLATYKIPFLCASNTHLDELQEQERSRVDGGKTWNDGIVVETAYPDQNGIALAFENAVKGTKYVVPHFNLESTKKIIGKYLNGCNLGIVYNTFRNIIDKHTKKRLFLDIADPLSRSIIIPELATQLKKAIEGTASSLKAIKDNQNIALEKKQRRVGPLQESLNQYQAQYNDMVTGCIIIKQNKIEQNVDFLDTLVKDAFVTSERVDTLVKKLSEFNDIINPLEKKKVEEKLNKEEKKLEKDEIVEKKPADKPADKIEEKIVEKKPENKQEEKTERKIKNNSLNELVKKLTEAYEKSDPYTLIKLFKEHTKKEQSERYDPLCAQYAVDYGINEQDYPDPEYRSQAMMNLAQELKYRPTLRYGIYKGLCSGTKILKSSVNAIATVGYGASYYTALVNLPSMVSKGLPIISSAASKISNGLVYACTSIVGKNRKQKELNITAYRQPLDTFSRHYKVPHHTALVAMLGNMIQNSPKPTITWAKAMQGLTTEKLEADKFDLEHFPGLITIKKTDLKKGTHTNETFANCAIGNTGAINMHQWAKNLSKYVSKKGVEKF